MVLPLSRRDRDKYDRHAWGMSVRLWWGRWRLVSLGNKVLTVLGLVLSLSLAAWVWRGLDQQAALAAGLAAWTRMALPPGTIPVLIPVYSRAHYLHRVLQSLQRADGVQDFVLVFSQDGRRRDIADAIASVNFTRTIHLLHNPPYGGWPSMFIRTDAPTASNVYFLLQFAFEYVKAPAAIVLESDIEVGVDALRYFEWAHRHVATNPTLRDRVFTVNGYYERSRADADPFQFTTRQYGFMVWGWLCPGHMWPRIKRGWTWFHNWDITLEESVRKPSGLVSLSPAISRTRNIGMVGINFNVVNAVEQAQWESLPITTAPSHFAEAMPNVLDMDEYVPMPYSSTTAARRAEVTGATRGGGWRLPPPQAVVGSGAAGAAGTSALGGEGARIVGVPPGQGNDDASAWAHEGMEV